MGPNAYFIPVSLNNPGFVAALAANGGASVTQFDFLGRIQAVTARCRSFQYHAGFTLEPGNYHLKFVVRENITGKLGTLETKFIVPDLSADTSGLKLSIIIWSSQRQKITSAVGSAGKVTMKELTANPLVVGDEKVIPNITKVFRRSRIRMSTSMFMTQSPIRRILSCAGLK